MHCFLVRAMKRKSSRMWTIELMDNLCLLIHSRADEIFSKIQQLDEHPMGRQLSKYRLPLHLKPSKGLSDGLIGTIRNADLMSHLAIQHPRPRLWMMATASVMDA